jgi:trehalose/maltose hydrolase-like predicted phosphorylase
LAAVPAAVAAPEPAGATGAAAASLAAGGAGTRAGSAAVAATVQPGSAWNLSTTSWASSNDSPTFIGNGYMGLRVPAAGMGYSAQPVETQAQVAGYYAYPSNPYPQDNRASIPVWSTLDFSAGGGTYGQVPEQSGCVYDAVCQSENATLAGGTSVATNHSGYTGTGFVQGYQQTGASASFTVADVPADGQYVVAFRYANYPAGSGNPTTCLPRTLSAYVNGQDVATAAAADTGSWDNWAIWQTGLTLKAGTSTIALTQDADDCGNINIDYLTVSAPGAPLPVPQNSASGQVTKYRQTLNMQQGVVTTTATWISPAGTATDLTYRIFTDRAREHVGVIQVTITPHWSGQASVLDAFDGADANLTTQVTKSYDPSDQSISETVQTVGRDLRASEASRLRLSGLRVDGQQEIGAAIPQSIGQQASFHVVSGHTYEVTKYVGVTTSQDTADPVAAAEADAGQAASLGYRGLVAENAASWANLWTARITVLGDPSLQSQVRASTFYLLASTRQGSDWSLSPAGLSSNDYGGWVFWDADTWMYPALLAQYPDIAQGVDTYRQQRLGAAEQLAQSRGNQGAEYPWQSGLSGADNITMAEIHVTADVALAQWQYYEATGDRQWLATKAWPVLQGIATFYSHVATPDPSGGYDINGIEPPDEYHQNVNNDAYTNVSGATALQIATQAANILGKTADPQWSTVAQGLIKTVPYDAQAGIDKEYDGYDGSAIKQADVVMLQYPWQFPMPASVAQANLDYYAPRTDLGGPAMTDAINAIDTAELGTPGCASYTYLERSDEPFMQPPFDQFSEYRGGGGAFTFTTGIGGFLQEFLYGFTGLRWNQDAVTIDPMLPPQLPGLELTKMSWHGRTFNITIGPEVTKITLTSGNAMPLKVGDRQIQVLHHAGETLTFPTRRPDVTPTSDTARCRNVTATASNPSFPAVAAVDGSPATWWQPTTAGASLTVDLGQARTIDRIVVDSATGGTTPYSIEVSQDNKTWQLAGTVPTSSNPSSSLAVPSIHAQWVRYTAGTDVTPEVSDLKVITASTGTPP